MSAGAQQGRINFRAFIASRLTLPRLSELPSLNFHSFPFLRDYGLAALARDPMRHVLQNPAGLRLAAALFICADPL